jgi:hypothetical protein
MTSKQVREALSQSSRPKSATLNVLVNERKSPFRRENSDL